MELHQLKNEISNLAPAYPALIGAAASAKIDLPLAQYQQFPPVIQDMYNQLPELQVFLLLIDPLHENPPYVAQEYALHDIHRSECHYSSLDGRLQTFVYRQRVYTDPDHYPPADALNITSTVRDLNEFAKEKQVSLVYHDFTGRHVALLADYLDPTIITHLDQIVYGLSGREDHGCFFDLAEPQAYLPYRIDKSGPGRPILKLFNYYKYIMNNTYSASEAELQKYPAHMHRCASIQKARIISTRLSQFKKTNMSILRQVRQLLQDLAHEHIAHDKANYIFNDLPYVYRQMFIDLYNEKEYELLYELTFNYSANLLDSLAKLKEMDMTGEELLQFITSDEDPYKWYNTINTLL